MKRLLIFMGVLSLLLAGCSKGKSKVSPITADTLPQTHVNVTKEYDKDGNIIGYDSTYSYYYSNIKGNTLKRDSIFDLFRNRFYQKYPFSNHLFFDNLFFEDSLLKYDFYKKDFFSTRFRHNMRKMDSLFLQMDAMKDDFFMHQFPQGDNKPEKKQSKD